MLREPSPDAACAVDDAAAGSGGLSPVPTRKQTARKKVTPDESKKPPIRSRDGLPQAPSLSSGHRLYTRDAPSAASTPKASSSVSFVPGGM